VGAGAIVFTAGAADCAWDAMELLGPLCPSCVFGCADGEDESGGEGNREAPPLEDGSFWSAVTSGSVASHDRLEGVEVDTGVLYFGGEVGERI
jgi:hypothetical protein